MDRKHVRQRFPFFCPRSTYGRKIETGTVIRSRSLRRPALPLLLITGLLLPIGAVRFASAAVAGRSSDPLDPRQSLATIHLKEGYEIELVASEPQITSPVAIDWGADGRLWVVEMDDYPYGMDGQGRPGGRVRVLEDTRHEGHFDKSAVFLDGIMKPNGICVWRNGVLVTAAPEIFYAEDATGLGRADVHKTLFTGFKPGNPQLRVNGLRWGLDGWVYCANGWSGGKPRSLATGRSVDLSGHDIRLDIDRGLLDLQSGQSEFGRDRDDWGNWFGCDNSHPLFHFALDDDYTRRNPNVPFPDPRYQVVVPANPKVFPVSKPQKRYYEGEARGHFTSACSATIYRDEPVFPGEVDRHMFVCEPAYNLVNHEVLHENGVSFAADRAADEQDREFLASEDQWFRPVMVRTGPDGALWVVDMYRYMIEHPDWLPAHAREELKNFYRDGEDRGRIYRIYPKGHRPGPLPRIDRMSTEQLVAAMDCTNGTLRDMIQKQLVWKNDRVAIDPLKKLAHSSNPAVRLQAMYTLELLGGLTNDMIAAALSDPIAPIRRAAVRLAEPRAKDDPKLMESALKLADDPDPRVRLQLACSLGAWESAAAGEALGRIAVAGADDAYLSAAVMSSAPRHFEAIVRALTQSERPLAEPLFGSALMMALGTDNRAAMASLLTPALEPHGGQYSSAQFAAIGRFLSELSPRRTSVQKLCEKEDELSSRLGRLPEVFAAARGVAMDQDKPADLRAAAAGLLGREPARLAEDMRSLAALLAPQVPPEVQGAAVSALGRLDDPRVPDLMVHDWSGHSPQVRLAVVDRLVQRDPWAAQLLEAIRSGGVSRNDLDAAHRQRLLEHASDQVKSLARQVLGAPPDTSRERVVEQYQPALSLEGDVQRGAKIFVQNCAVCHHKGDFGADIGPNLDSVTAWRGDALLVAILDPSRQVEPGYLAYTVTLNDGDAVYGLITSETGNSLTMKGLDGKPRTLLRGQIKAVACTNRSLMPDGFEAALDKQAIADVIRFLQSSTSPEKLSDVPRR